MGKYKVNVSKGASSSNNVVTTGGGGPSTPQYWTTAAPAEGEGTSVSLTPNGDYESITLTKGDKSVTFGVDTSGNFVVDGNIIAKKDVVAYGVANESFTNYLAELQTKANAILDDVKKSASTYMISYIGTRNYLLKSSAKLAISFPVNSYNQYNYNVPAGLRLSEVGEEFYVTFQCKVDNWSQTFPPITDVIIGQRPGGDAWSMRVSPTKYIQLTSTTRLYYGSTMVVKGTKNFGNVYGGGYVKVLCENRSLKSKVDGTVYELMLTRGNVLTDWVPAVED